MSRISNRLDTYGSTMVKYSNSNIKLVTTYFRKNLPGYHLITESSHGPFWTVKFAKGEIEISVSGDIGFSIEIFIDKTRYDLWQYDRSLNETTKTNAKNILYQLGMVKRFLSESV